jgi:hypothetical protein
VDACRRARCHFEGEDYESKLSFNRHLGRGFRRLPVFLSLANQPQGEGKVGLQVPPRAPSRLCSSWFDLPGVVPDLLDPRFDNSPRGVCDAILDRDGEKDWSTAASGQPIDSTWDS